MTYGFGIEQTKHFPQNLITKKSGSALVSPDRQMFFCKKSRSLTFIAEGYLTRGARRWSWTILEVEYHTY